MASRSMLWRRTGVHARPSERLDQPDFLVSVLARIPANRVDTLTDIAAATIYLAPDHAGMITGSALVVDGGWTLR